MIEKCRHCGGEITRALPGHVWTHSSTDTRTGTPHVTCGYQGERGTSAEPFPPGWEVRPGEKCTECGKEATTFCDACGNGNCGVCLCDCRLQVPR